MVNSYRIHRKITNSHRACTVFKVLFKIFHLYKKVSKQKGAMLDCSKTTAESRKLLYNNMAKPPWVHGRGLDTFFAKKSFQLAARDVECTTLGPRKLLSICRSRLVAQLALLQLQNPA